jgi:transcription antitermination factor NusG
MTDGIRAWFALQVRPRYEKKAAAALKGKGVEHFLPLCRERRRWSDRLKDVSLPLFPGYVFCRFDPFNRLPILTTTGVASIVGAGKIPEPVPDHEIAAVQAIVDSGLGAQPWPFIKVGQRVQIETGPLFGLEGILADFRGSQRLVVSVSLLQRSVAVEIDRLWVKPLPPRKVPAHESSSSMFRAKLA